MCQRNVELDIVDSLQFILNKYRQDTKTNAHCSWTLSLQPDLLALLPYHKLRKTQTCLQGFNIKTCWLQQTLQRKQKKRQRDLIFSHCQTTPEHLSRSATRHQQKSMKKHKHLELYTAPILRIWKDLGWCFNWTREANPFSKHKNVKLQPTRVLWGSVAAGVSHLNWIYS